MKDGLTVISSKHNLWYQFKSRQYKDTASLFIITQIKYNFWKEIMEVLMRTLFINIVTITAAD